MAGHLRDLSVWVGRQVSRAELLDPKHVEETGEAFRDMQPSKSFTVALEDKSGERFRKFLERLRDSNSSPVDLWTQHARICGPLRVDSLLELDWKVCLDDGDVIALSTSDHHDRMLLDVSEENGLRTLLVELTGPSWGAVDY
jgi:hypothetical protein